MNFALSDEQVLLREAARGALSRFKTIEAARAALEDPATLPDLWPTALDAGWPGLLIDEQHGGAELGAFDALLVAEECGRVLASVPLLGLLPATAILQAAGDQSLSAVAAGELRPVYVPARPSGDVEARWTVYPRSGFARADAPRAVIVGDRVVLDGTVAFVPDAPGSDLLVAVGVTEAGSPVAGVIATGEGATGVELETVTRYDATVAIGSYQAIKHELTEILRRLENSRGRQYYAGWARESKPEEFPLAASAARSAAGHTLDFATRSMINVHGGIGATWEHDAPLFFRRAQLSRRLIGGTQDATDRVAERAMPEATAA
jgi:alkylation response protein AidB-like acyl-CoA dehydrogenase